MAKKLKKVVDSEDEKFYPDEEQGMTKKKSFVEKEDEIVAGERDEDLDTAEGRERQVEDDEVEPWEAGFAAGASEEGQLGKDALTGEPLMGADDIIELELDGKMYRFVSQANAEQFREKKLKSGVRYQPAKSVISGSSKNKVKHPVKTKQKGKSKPKVKAKNKISAKKKNQKVKTKNKSKVKSKKKKR
ncbi:hypothetical protein J4437_07065 [Candidatus Woesearchaeota archaeon]|nr:hypothetical protein [Candidatus Woesearchaeota archaeon]